VAQQGGFVSTVLTDEQRAMVLANVPLVEHIVNRVAANLPASHSREDLVQTGILGLITATVRYDPNVGTAFSTFAGRRIEGAVIDLLRRADWAPRSVRSLERQLSTAEDRNAELTDATADRLGKELGVSTQQIHQLRHDIAKARLDSLDRPVGGEDMVVPLSATLVDSADRAEDIVDHHELLGYLRDSVTLLPERHRVVVVGYYFEGRSITELGQLLGVSQSRASQIKDEALTMLRKGLKKVYAEAERGIDAESADSTTKRPGSRVNLTERERSFAESMASSMPWRDRLDAGKGISVIS
jgi:RNA polymerase sigma factor for flagellar operon FliA